MKNTIPASLAPFFQEYDLAALTPEHNSHTIIERVLQFGNRSEIKWLFTVYSRERIVAWVRRWGSEVLPEPDRTFWHVLLGTQQA
jgi:hypothetical protein